MTDVKLKSSQYIRDKRARGRPVLTAERVREQFYCDPIAGTLTNRLGTGGRKKGMVAGTIGIEGYRQVFIDYWAYRVSRVMYLHVAGKPVPDSFLSITSTVFAMMIDGRIYGLSHQRKTP